MGTMEARELSITVVCPVIGRLTLPRMLESLKHQTWGVGSRLLLLSDDNHDFCAKSFNEFGVIGQHIAELDGPLGFWGHRLRNKYCKQVDTSHVCYFHDDDVALPNMLTDMFAAATTDMFSTHMFRMRRFPQGDRVWSEPKMEVAKVAGENVLHRNENDFHGRWGLRYEGDFDFIEHVSQRFKPKWHDVTTCLYSPPADWSYQQCLDWYKENG